MSHEMTSEEHMQKFQLAICHYLDLRVVPLIGRATREICVDQSEALARSEK